MRLVRTDLVLYILKQLRKETGYKSSNLACILLARSRQSSTVGCDHIVYPAAGQGQRILCRFSSIKVFPNDEVGKQKYIYLAIIPRVHVGYELAIIISYPTSASGIIILLKTPTKYREFFPTLFVNTTDFQLVFNFEQTRTVTIFGEHGITVHIP